MTNVEQRKFVVRVHILNKACTDGTTQSQAGEGSDSDRRPKEGSSHYYKAANTPAVSYTSKDFSEENPSAYESVQLHDPRMPSKDYVLAGKCDLTLAQEKKIQALLGKIRPEIPVLVAQMKKSNVESGRGNLHQRVTKSMVLLDGPPACPLAAQLAASCTPMGLLPGATPTRPWKFAAAAAGLAFTADMGTWPMFYSSSESACPLMSVVELRSIIEPDRLASSALRPGVNKVELLTPVSVFRQAIPKDYALKYFPCESTSIKLQLPNKNKAWKCRLHIRPSGVHNPGRRSLYWRLFAVDNHVREGDICLFQPMTNDKHRTFIVIVHLLHKASVESSPGGRSDVGSNHGRRSAKMVLTANVNEEPATDGEEISPSGHENAGDSDDSEGASEPLFVAPDRPRLTDAQKKKVLEKVHAIGSESLPICVIVMNNTSVRLCKSSNSSNSSGPYLTFSKQYVSRYLEKQYFTRHHAKKNVISLVLEREGGSRRWHTELRLGNNRPMIVKGWTSFARDNRLQVDDLCLFKLMRNEETLKMMVYIIRRKKCLA
uniref:B3 domain-containing protein n=1 Tax=Aegilops tauschii TaxID=37682 RepID=M8CEW4_AEGTA